MAITLKAARANKDMTLIEAAKELGINKDTLSAWENAKSYPNAIQIKRIEEVYAVEFNDLIFSPQSSV